jgi:hypothetical protein
MLLHVIAVGPCIGQAVCGVHVGEQIEKPEPLNVLQVSPVMQLSAAGLHAS